MLSRETLPILKARIMASNILAPYLLEKQEKAKKIGAFDIIHG